MKCTLGVLLSTHGWEGGCWGFRYRTFACVCVCMCGTHQGTLLWEINTNAAAGISPAEREKEAVFLASRSGAAAMGLKPGCRRAPASTPAPTSSPRFGSEEGKRRGPWHPAEPDRARGVGGWGGGRPTPSRGETDAPISAGRRRSNGAPLTSARFQSAVRH